MTRRDEIIEDIQHLHVEIDGLLEEIRELRRTRSVRGGRIDERN
ncbi:hypothetical protein [Bacillus sp. CBA7126]|nr:hypothetical protein [Bacillus sp. CBA7126]